MAERQFKLSRQEARRLWVEALRSGEYEQGVQNLKRVVGGVECFCCLGLGCQLFNEHEPEHAVSVELIGDTYYFDSCSASMPEIVVRWLGLNGHWGNADFYESLAYHNDEGATFSEIADIIESAPEGLFVEESHA